jgi:hypothetical protein
LQLGRTIRERKYHTQDSSYVYEEPGALDTREKALDDTLAGLRALVPEKRAVNADHAARTAFQDKVRLWVRSHRDAHGLIVQWSDLKRQYLQTKETVNDIQQAQLQLGILSAFRLEKDDMNQGAVAALKTSGDEIRAAEYKTAISGWRYEKPDEVSALESHVEGPIWTELEALANRKLAVLDDDLAREQFKEAVRLKVNNHAEVFQVIADWGSQQLTFLGTKEEVSNSEEAKGHLSLLDAFEVGRDGMKGSNVATLLALGDEIDKAIYKTELSQWTFEDKPSLTKRHAKVDELWSAMAKELTHKRAVLEDDRDRELYAEATRLLADRHAGEAQRLQRWADEKAAYLRAREACDTTAEAEYLLSVLDACQREVEAKAKSAVASLHQLGERIRARKYHTKLSEYVYEEPATLVEREASVDARWDELRALEKEKRPFLQDHLARNQFQDDIRLRVSNHRDAFLKVQAWVGTKTIYLQERETISSVSDARLHLGLLNAYDNEKQDMSTSAVASLRAAGEEIRAAEYKTELSAWKYEKPEEVRALELQVDAMWEELTTLSDEKRRVLDDHLAREQYAADTRLLAGQHDDKFAQLLTWAAEKSEYLEVREVINTVRDALYHLSVHDVYVKEKVAVTSAALASLKALGAEVHSRKYETKYSTYVYELPEDITAREETVGEEWAELDRASAQKRPILEDHLARNRFQDKVRLWVKNHADSHADILAWAADRRAYLQTKELISNIQQAQLQLSTLDAFRQEKDDTKQGAVAALIAAGAEIRAAEYKTAISEWRYEKPEEVTALETEIVEPLWTELDTLANKKQLVLDDDLAREQFKEAVRLQVKNHGAAYSRLVAWAEAGVAYLKVKEQVSNSEEAKRQLSRLSLHDQRREGMVGADVAALRTLGDEIRAARHKTEYSEWAYEHPDRLRKEEADIDTRWASLVEASAGKRAVLDDDLARELYAEETRILANQHDAKQQLLMEWVKDKGAYLDAAEEAPTTQDALFHISVLEAFRRELAAMTASSLASLHELGRTILARKYATTISQYTYEEPTAITGREATLQAPWTALSSKATSKGALLEDHRLRNIFKDAVVLSVEIHGDLFAKIRAWVDEKNNYLADRETIEETREARLCQSLLAAYDQEKKDKRSGSVAALRKRGDEIRTAKYQSPHSAWAYDKAEDVKALEDMVEVFWNELDGERESKDAFLQDALARTELKARILLLADRHRKLQGRIMDWAGARLQYLKADDGVDSLSAAAVRLRLLEAFELEKKGMSTTSVATLKALGQEVLTTTYSSPLSSWAFPEPPRVGKLEEQVDATWTELNKLVDTKRASLQADQKREEEKESLRQDFAHAAHAMQGYVQDTIILVQDRPSSGKNEGAAFGFTLEETQKYRATLQKDDTRLLSAASDKKRDSEAVHKSLAAYGPIINPYTSLDLPGLEALLQELRGALAARMKQYEEELQRKEANDALCRRYGDVVNPLVQHIRDSMDVLTKPEGSLESQLSTVQSALDKAQEERRAVDGVKSLSAEITERNIQFNPYTTVTIEDMETQLQDFTDILVYKKPLLEQEIEFKRSRGVTQAQIDVRKEDGCWVLN